MSVTSLMNQSLTLYPKASYDRYGREVVGSGSSVICRFQATTKTKLLANGEIAQIEGIVYVPSTTTVEIDDKVTFNSKDFKVFGKYTAVDGDGVTNHIRLELIQWKHA